MSADSTCGVFLSQVSVAGGAAVVAVAGAVAAAAGTAAGADTAPERLPPSTHLTRRVGQPPLSVLRYCRPAGRPASLCHVNDRVSLTPCRCASVVIIQNTLTHRRCCWLSVTQSLGYCLQLYFGLVRIGLHACTIA